MRRRAIALAAVVVLAVTARSPGAAAQTVEVRSGEHEGFSRLVLDIGPDRQWRLDGAARRRALRLDPPVDGFVTADVFRLIPRDRLAGLSAGGGGSLEMELGCDCPVEATRYRDRYLVIDIADPPATGDGLSRSRGGPTPSGDWPARLPDMTRVLTDADGRVPPLAGGIAPPGARPGPAPPPAVSAPLAAQEVDIERAAQIMAEQLSRAAASGLLDAAAGRPLSDADPVDRSASATAAPPEPPGADTVPDAETPGALPIRAATALDAPHRGTGPAPQRNSLSCAGDAMDVAGWSASPRVDAGLGALRRDLFDARGMIQPGAVVALARHYIHFGFGAEAAFWLDRLAAPPADLRVIAALIDGRDGPRFPPESDPVTCSAGELLWRYLGGALGADAVTAEQAGRLQRATVALPGPLRDHIGPRVARHLMADGFAAPARHIRDWLARAGTLPDTRQLQLDIDLGVPRGDPAELRGALDGALRDDGADPVTAMAQALAFDRRHGTAVFAERLSAAEALLRENGIGPRTAALWHEVVLARGARGDVAGLTGLLSQVDVPDETRQGALTALFADRVAEGDLTALYILARLFGSAWQAEGSEAGRARVAAIAALRAAGLSGGADALRVGQRLLILPARPRPDPEPGAALSTAWHGGDWAGVAAGARPPHATIAARMDVRGAAPGGPGNAAPDLSLAALDARIADSRSLRDEIGALLSDPAPQPAEAAP